MSRYWMNKQLDSELSKDTSSSISDVSESKFYLCFWVGDGGDRESYSVYYSKLVLARSRNEALDKYISSGKNFAHHNNKDYYDAIEMKDIIK